MDEPPRPAERVDAARNRRRILDAAHKLVAERGIAAVSIPDIARAADVGAGTIYRRFGDRAGLAAALLDERHRDLQDQIIRGEPPLGPGADPSKRLIAFGDAYLDFLDEHAELLLAAQHAHAPTALPAYRQHVTLLLQQATSGLDLTYVTGTLFAALDPALHLHLRRDDQWTLQRLKHGWANLALAWLNHGASPAP